MRRITSIVLALSLIAGCRPATEELTDARKAEIAAEVDAAATAWWDAWAAVDYERGMSFVEDAPETAWVGDQGILYRVAGMNDAWAGSWCADCERQQIDFTDQRTIVLAPDVAYTIRQYDDVVVDTTGTARPTVKGVETVVWVKRDGEWKVLLGHESTLAESWQTRLDLESR